MQKINSSANIFIFADKTSNIYKMKPQNNQYGSQKRCQGI